ncbi:putative calpain-like cysteine peptidase putativecysteine peptidase Clan CA family C2 [Leptomonas pyrrhocoris]|uniref:Putative calpain-like cysteine peptidase putativecysteine peptidase Clan CA family C2 n=1 Tax=Leptomonas pyrrhocoris TaxID=157538 RepID=A0A0M9FPX8_LEPPY|nr:putative calpain-like cysteine peptidase putativecysteine peptidase Clan CA family C2 [Leptomonas pyrrhocoris]XP_015651925.1 putative calpain-like cysteine peptidase putativecysteine peptidase Clan CA family C2 [Leptomonas pyrrhocoris]KPA73485.1 putative calpain-like cysteine peptidase putativecysteine peptidase Clan CA family C2 [Leptomonas pyrrhocoris]KPA73486.1 putative calpain-like cysteine peptidase putativecysteine peptidase Clan CA family C2 [Leptomonas pyrrhocoris]|eukprot:XP_015651924.1 putative calpain-like cysteine peptidase putativecysteine peptidase Clan CA family C2 [Leptomonas pyrrhocoris]
MSIQEVPDSNKLFADAVFDRNNSHISQEWKRIKDIYPSGVNQPLLPETFSREQFGQGNHYECFMLSALSTLIRFPDVIRSCFVSKKVREDGRYTFQFFRGEEWVKVEIDDKIAMEEGEVLYCRSPTEHWWPLLLEKAYAKFYTAYDHLEGCTLQETFHDLTGNPVLNIPMDAKLAKAAGAEVTEGFYWLDLAQRIQSGQFVASVLTKDIELENMGLQREQQYGVLEIFSLTGTSSINDIVIHLHNPFEDEEYVYKGPLNSKDTTWDAKQRAKHDVDDERSIFLPLNTFLKIMNSIQLCYMTPVEVDATYFHDEWKGESAGGNPTFVTWRKNPLYYVRNTGSTASEIVVVIKQEDQRRFTSPDEMTKYLQCGMVLINYSYANPIPTFWVTGNNHKPIHKSLFLNSREVANSMTIPPNSLCYLVPSCMLKGAEGGFSVALYRMKGADYSDLTIKKLAVPGIAWANPATKNVELHQKEKDRVDFYVDEASDVHVLLHQQKPFVSKSGGDAMTEDYMGMYLYDDTDRKIGGVHAATNFREISIIHHLPRSGRYALSLTCPRAKGDVPAYVTIVATPASHVRIVDPPEDATMFDDEDLIDEGDEADQERNPIDYVPFIFDTARHTEPADSASPFEDKRFFTDNRGVTTEPWVHIGDLYPEGKTKPLLPDVLNHGQFEQGDHYDCSALTGFAALAERNADVIRNCFISKQPRKDGRYTFQFHRYGQWVKVEIDDRIPMIKGDTVFCRSPTHHWWPLLLEKAYAKFYTLYQNLEGISQGEVFHDFSGRPVLFIPMEAEKARTVDYDIGSAQFWRTLNRDLEQTAVAALALGEQAEQYGLHHEDSYALLGLLETRNAVDLEPADILVKFYNPFEDSPYRGPMHKDDPRWTAEMRSICNPAQRNIFYVPADVFLDVFANIQQAWVKGPLDPCRNFNSEWGESTAGGNPSLVTWRDNPLYTVRNDSEDPVQIIGMIRQPDQRHLLHRQTNHEVNYVQCALVVTQSTSAERIPTYLVTGNNHRRLRSGLYLHNREVTDVITIPPNSLCYVVPTGMQRDKSKFIFSYWFLRNGDEKKVDIRRLNIDVARQLPAIAHVDLKNKGHGRVDFVVDVPTDVHILLKQEKPFKHQSGGDAIAQDFVSMYLYDGNDKRISPSAQATNNREIGLVQHLDKPGRYALGVNCTAGVGEVPCKVEVVAVERAQVRITEAPENARELGEVDLSFLDQEPEGVPLADVPLDTDPKFQEQLDALKRLHNNPEGKEDSILALEKQMNDRAHELAKAVLAKERPKYLSGNDLSKLAPLLDEDPEYTNAERMRHLLKGDPRNAAKVREIEGDLRERAAALADATSGVDLNFMDPEYEGIPRDDIELLNDPTFAEMAQTRANLLRNPAANARKIDDVEDQMHERAADLAKAMHEKERTYLDREPEGVPLDLLPLNEDEPFSKMEDELRALNRKPKKDMKAIKDLQKALNDRAHELAAKLKHDERELFLDPQPYGIPVAELPLDTDAVFHPKEIDRLQLRKEDPLGNRDDIRGLEDELNDRARELAKNQQANQRSFLEPDPYGVPLEKLGLDCNDEFLKKEEELRALQKDPRKNAKAIEDLKDDMRALADRLAAAEAARDRNFLDPEPEGRLVQTLPLLENPEFKDLDTKRRRTLNRGGDASKVPDMEERLNDIAHEVAHGMNVAERPDYMDATYKGIPAEDLPLDQDQPFHAGEVKRQQLKQDPRRNARGIADAEQGLNDRAMELAEEKLKGDRNYLDPEPEGVPLRLVPLDKDATFAAMEAQRAKLKKDPRKNAKAIADLEGQLNDRAHELAKELKEKERPKFLDAKFNGIPYAELPLNSDQPFRDMEVQRLLLKEQPQKNATAIQDLEEALNDRAGELAKEQLAQDRAFLDQCPLGVPLEELPLDSTPAFVAKEEKLRALRRDPRRNAAAIDALQKEMNEMVHALAAEELGKMRGFLDPEPEGRLLDNLPLNEDPTFHKLETRYRDLKKSPKANPQEVADLEELMNDRAHELAKDMNRKERPNFMSPAPKGVPLSELPLDTDEEFSNLEAQRARLMRQPAKNRKAIVDIEDALNLRAEELAQEKIQADRAFMEEAPQNVPLKYIPLDKDKDFAKMEAQRTALRANNQSTRGVDPKIRELESAMNEHANEMAKAMKQQVRSNVLPTRVGGIAREALQLDDDVPFADLEVAHIAATGDGEPEKARDLGDAMQKRAVDVAAKMRGEERAILGHPLGFSPEDLPLDRSPEYLKKEAEVLEQRADPKRNAAVIKAGEDVLRDMALEMAKQQAAEERKDYIDPELEGRKQSDLGLDDDPTFLGIEEQYRKSKKDPYADDDRLHDLEQMMNDRAHDLAKAKNAEDRTKYMDQSPRNVPLSELPLDTDDEFGRLEAQRAKLCQDPRRNAQAIKQTEDALNDRADELAAEALKNDRIFLDDEPEGVAQRHLPLDEDPTFRSLEMKRAALKSAPSRDGDAIRAVEEQMNQHLHDMAREVKQNNRRDMDPDPLGIPLEDLDPYLDEDQHFHELEEMYRDAKQNPAKAKAAQQLLDQMNERAKEVAQAVHDMERRPLNPDPSGIPLETLPLNDDAEFNALENEARALRNEPNGEKKNANRLGEIEDGLNARAAELADEARKRYVDKAPEGIPMELLNLGDDPAFTDAETQLRRLERNPVANRKGIKDMKDDLNMMAHEKAKKMLQQDRGYLDPEPEDVELRHVPLDTDSTFRDIEAQRAALKAKDPRGNAKAIAALEQQLNDRAHQLAKEVKDNEVRALEPDPLGVPYNAIVPHHDDQFKELATQLRELKQDPKRNAQGIREVKEKMNERGVELAEGMLKNDRGYLEPEPEGVPLTYLPLDTDPQFNRMEVERAKLKARDPVKNAKKIEGLEDQLNDRARQLAEAQQQEDLRGLDPKPEGIPLSVLDPHSDKQFSSYLPQLRAMKADPRTTTPQLQEVLAAMNDRAHQLANEKLRGDRPSYLEGEPKGVPLELLPLDADQQFHDLEVQRAVLKEQDPRRNAAKIKDLEDRLRDRANELADQQRMKDIENLDQAPEGIPIALLNVHDDPRFAQMVDQHRELAKEPMKNDAKLAALEEQMNDRAHQLAKDLLSKDNAYLDRTPQGVPIEELPLDTDPEFRKLEVQRAVLKQQDPRRNAAKIKDLEEQLNNRAHELARAQLAEDLRGVEAAPRDLPVELLNPHADPKFAEAVQRVREAKKDPKAKADVQAVLDEMNNRVRSLADQVMDRDYLDRDPEGVPIAELPLDTDPDFHTMEVERAKLKLKDPKRNARAIKDLEQRLNDRAHELAKKQLDDDLSGCDAEPEGIPLALLKPTEDPQISSMIPQLRELKKSPKKNADAIQDLENRMNNRAYELADALLEGDRGYLDPKPEGVKLEYLPLDKDPEFAEMEVERAKLKAQNPRRNPRRIADLEDRLSDRAAELAEAKKADELSHFPPQYEGIDTAAMKPHDDPKFAALAEQLRALEKAGKANSPEMQRTLNDMDARLTELAKEKVQGDLWFLDKEPEGIPLEDVGVEADPQFNKLRQERASLKAKDPLRNADKIKELEEQMNDRAHDMAKDILASDFDGVDPNPMGIPLELLKPREGPQVAKILPELRRAKRNPRDAQKARDLQQQLDDRVKELANDALRAARPAYLDRDPEGVLLSDLPLDTDGIYNGLEVERAKLVLAEPVKNAKQIEDLEERLNERAHELAQQVLEDDLRNIDREPQGIPIDAVKPHNNADFHKLATQARELRKDPRRNADKLSNVEGQMNELANQMAAEMLDNDRKYLDPEPEGVPVAELPLNEDPEFHEMEVQRAVLIAQDPMKNKQAIADLEDKLNDRAHELAEEQKKEDLRGLNSSPLGVPVALLNPHEDPHFTAKLPELRAEKKDSSARGQARLNETQGKLDDVLDALAAEYLEKDRASYLDPNPEGIPIAALPLDNDPEFHQLETERLDLINKNARANKDAIRDLEDALNERAHELARQQRKGDRGYLDPEPEGIPLDVLPLDTDRQFTDLEARRAALKAQDPNKNAAAIHDLEDQLNDRAHQLAEDQIEEDLRAVSPTPEDIPVRMLNPHQDPEFARMVNALRALKADPSADPKKISDLEQDMNDRVHELANDVLSGDRPTYLDPKPEGISVETLPLDSDPLYHQLEVERAKLVLQDPKKKQAKIAELEERLNDRAHELAKEQRARDLADLKDAPRGIPVELLKPHDDDTFANLAAQRRDPNSAANKSRDIGGANKDPTRDILNERLDEMARQMLEGDRDYLDANPEGVPLRVLPLNDDPQFHDMEVERAKLKAKDPRGNAKAIRDLEDKLNDRANQLAKDALSGDRNYLDPEPEGVPLSALPLNSDPAFHQLEVERAKLKAQDPKKNADRINALEDQLNLRADELALAQKKEDLRNLDPKPRGVALESLNPHDDEEFASYLPELRRLKKEQPNHPKTREIQGKLDNRADELAKAQIARDRAFLDPEPEGIPLAQLPLDNDKTFTNLEKQLRQAKQDPKRNADRIAGLQEEMNDRAHELARDLLQGDRGYLDPEPEGVPIADVGIDVDPKFRELEAQRAKLKEDPKKNAAKIKDLEQKLNDRAHELAKAAKEAGRAFLNSTSARIPKALLPLDEDAPFQKMEQQLRRLNRDPRRNAGAIDNLKGMMQDRADELGGDMLRGDRDKYLDPNPEGVPLEHLPLDTDPQYSEAELQRAILKAQDPKANAKKINELEKALNDRAHELAKEQRQKDRSFLDPEPEGIPIKDVPLDKDPNFLRLEDYLRKLKKDPKRNADAIADTQLKMNDRAHELAAEVVADDLACLPVPAYRGIPKEDLNLHSYPKFRNAANRRRDAIRRGARTPDVKAIEEEMDKLAKEIADDVIAAERAFLDKEPGGMALEDIPLDNDKEFVALEAERRRRAKDPRAAKRNKDVIKDLEDKMNDRAHELARAEFAKQRGFMDQEPEGVPLDRLALDTDPEFKDAEIAHYKAKKDPKADPKKVAALTKRMNDRAHELAKKEMAKDRAFLDPEPEGVPLADLPLSEDPEFNELARQRQALKNAGKARDPKVKELEEKMNDRAHAIAKDQLSKNRAYLKPEPQNVPFSDLPLNRDPLFREMEGELMKAKKDPRSNADKIAQLQDDLNTRADDLAKELLQKERAGQEQEPMGVPLDELPLNYDPILNPLERKRRDLKKDPRKNADALRNLEPEIAARVNDIARDFLAKERAFLDQEPEGVPLERLPLADDKEFHDMEKELRALKKQPAKNKDAIEDLEERMNDRVHDLAKDFLAKDRDYLNPEPEGVPVAELPLNEDPTFHDLENQRRELKKNPRNNAKAIKDLEDKLNDRAEQLAKDKLAKERAFLDPKPEGILLKDLNLGKDKPFKDLERQLRDLRKDPRKNADAIKDIEADMNDRARTLAKRQLADDRNFMNPEPRGVPLADLALDEDPDFRATELARREAKKDPKASDKVRDLEEQMNKHADRVASDFLKKDRAYLDPEPEGVPLEELPLDSDPDFHGMEVDRRKLNKDPVKNAKTVKDLEAQLNDRAHELAKDKKGYQDPEFHDANEDIAEQWPRIRELYPEGVYDPVTPDTTLPSDVSSAPQDMGFLAPFIAALARHTVLISRLFQDKAHPQQQPYRITLFNPDSSPVTVEIDDRVPCDDKREPKFTQVPSRMWYPLLLEKAYAKFVGGYENFNNCNAHDTLRDLTGRPVLHISLEDPKHAVATNMGDYTTPAFWRRVIEDLERGDVFVCVANGSVPSGLHPQCSYALMDVFEVKPGTSDSSDIVVKVHNCYMDAPYYNGPLRKGDSNWTADVKRACDYTADENDMIYMPLPTFLQNFSCMQRCHINCGDRLSAPGQWDDFTAGGTSKYTTFRSNPIFLVANTTSRPATILAEVRHTNPLYVDETNCKQYPYTGLTLMQPINSKLPPTPFITNGTHKFLQKGMMLDSREVCAEMELPPSSTCYLIPYTKDRGTMGEFHVSIYPDMAKVTLTPLRHAGLTLKPLRHAVSLTPGDEDGQRLDFMVNDASDVHILLHQTKVSDPSTIRKGDAVAEDAVFMTVFNEYGIKIGTTGEASTAREHALVFKAPQGGRYSLLLNCTATSTSGPCTANLEIYTPADVSADFVPVAPDAKPLSLQSQSRFPTLSRTATAPSASRAASRGKDVRRTDSLPPVNQRSVSGRRGSREESGRHGSRGRR